MTNDSWIAVATIAAAMMLAAATLLAPAVGVYVQVRMTKPKAVPTTIQEQTVTFRMGKWLGQHAGKLLIFGLSVTTCFGLLILWLFPVGRLSVALTSLTVNLLSLQVGGYVSLRLFAWVYKQFVADSNFLYDAISRLQNQLSEHMRVEGERIDQVRGLLGD